MKVVVVGAGGLVGSRLTRELRRRGHDVVAASPSSGIDALTGTGLEEAMEGAHAVVDVINAPPLGDAALLAFFETAARNLVAAEAAGGVRHHVTLSVVGSERLLASGYFRAKKAQEDVVARSAVPFTIVRSTQFFEFGGRIAEASARGATLHVSPALVQPIAADEVAAALADLAAAHPANGTVELAGPETMGLDDFVRRYLIATGDPRSVLSDARALYFGAALEPRTLLPGPNARLGTTRFGDWLTRSGEPTSR